MIDEPIGFGYAATRKSIISLSRPRSVIVRIDEDDFEDDDEGVAVAGRRCRGVMQM